MSTSRGTTTDRLRHEIDRGKAADKVPFPDPAAAPLGTDDEAAGTPAAPSVVERVRQRESARQVDHRPIAAQSESAAQSRKRLVKGLAIAATVIAALAAALYWSTAVMG